MAGLRVSATHTFDNACPQCPGRGGQAGKCDHSSYSRRRVRFMKAHMEAYDAAYLNPDPRSAKNEMERLDNEYRTLPPRHDCSCWPTHCAECAKLAQQRVQRDSSTAVEAGRVVLHLLRDALVAAEQHVHHRLRAGSRR